MKLVLNENDLKAAVVCYLSNKYEMKSNEVFFGKDEEDYVQAEIELTTDVKNEKTIVKTK